MNFDLDKDDLISKCEALSPREKEALRGLGKHRRPKEIARALNISEHTVRGYANEARQKLGAVSTRDAAVLFMDFEGKESPPQIRGCRSASNLPPPSARSIA